MRTVDSAKRRARHALVGSMRACVGNDRIPLFAKQIFVMLAGGPGVLVRPHGWTLKALGIESDETPVKSDYGTKFVAGRDSSKLTSFLRFRGAVEPVLSEFIQRHVQEGDVCIDAGANIGYFSLLCAQRVAPSGKVIAIEPAPDNVRRLRANLELNGAADIVDVIEAACAPQKGEINLYLHGHNGEWCRLNPPAKGDWDRRLMGKTWIPVTVAADTLTSIAGADAQRVSFIKIDVEGAETAITPQIPAGFSHPGLVVALEVRAQIEATLMPFQKRGFYVYDMHSDHPWLFERKVPAITQVAYRDLYHRDFVEVLLSRQPLGLS
jgi:FkbM family methyltransferase